MAENKAPEKKPEKGLTKRWEKYETSGGLKRKLKSCPKCGSGVFMAQHKDRTTCGNCQYTEFNSKKDAEEKPAESKKDAEESKPEEKPAESKPEEKLAETK